MSQNIEKYAKYFLEISSEQRLRIIHIINEEQITLSELSKKLDATTSEVHRNLERLEKSGFLIKNGKGHFVLTAMGQMVLNMTPNLSFMIKNKKYFLNHPINSLPQKFISRLGELIECKPLTSYVNTFECWKEIYENSQEYIYNILYDVPYFDDFVNPIFEKVSNGIKVKSIFYDKAIFSNSRNDILKKFKKHIDNEDIQRKMIKNVGAAVVLNEKQACLIFPNLDEKLDVGFSFTSEDPSFHEWCYDFFNYTWYNAHIFQEKRLEK